MAASACEVWSDRVAVHEEIALELTDDGLIGHLERRVEVRATMRDFVAYYNHGRERPPSPNHEPSLSKCALFVRILLATYQETPGGPFEFSR